MKRRFISVHGAYPEPAYVAELEVALGTIVDEMQIPCAVVLIRSEPKGDWSGICGTRRLGTDDPVTIDDHFRVGSNTKTMTGTVVLQLVEEGDLSLDDPVSNYRPDVPNGDHITLAMLLEMRSGLYNYSADAGFNARLDDEPGHVWRPSELLAIAFAHQPSFDPAADFEYSNTNTVLLGLIIEQRTKLSLKDAFQQRIFDRLRLHPHRVPRGRRREHPVAAPSGLHVRDQREHARGPRPSGVGAGGGGRRARCCRTTTPTATRRGRGPPEEPSPPPTTWPATSRRWSTAVSSAPACRRSDWPASGRPAATRPAPATATASPSSAP